VQKANGQILVLRQVDSDSGLTEVTSHDFVIDFSKIAETDFTVVFPSADSGAPTEVAFTFCLTGPLEPGPISLTFTVLVLGIFSKYYYTIKATDQDDASMFDFTIITNPN
tara:strand:+ start:1648 stop:1977 length:330 start_codon:yes stop_codon:yes gene_type:complete